MKLKVITTCDNPNHPGYLKLKSSLDRFGYDHEVIVHPFSFGHQMPVVQKWCNNYKGDCTHILYTDAFDTIAFAGPEEVKLKVRDIGSDKTVMNGWLAGYSGYKMIISGEKNCYPHPERAKDYPESNTPWRYVNGGGWLVEIEFFKQLCIKEKLTQQSHDQLWLMECFLNDQQNIKVDTQCEIFQTIAFSNKEEWEETEDRFRNIGTNTFPVFFHGNGHTEMNWVYDKQKILA